MVDGVPVLSQVKSFIQLVTWNKEGAEDTQITFVKLFPVLSQGTSFVQWMYGEADAARETQIQSLKGVGSMVDGIPGVGHLKGLVHYGLGDKEGGDNAMKAATHDACVLGGGIGGFFLDGPAGAVGGGIAAGIAIYSIISVCDYAANGKDFELYGSIDTVWHIRHDPTDGGTYVDVVGGLVLDGATGYGTVKGPEKTVRYKLNERKLAEVVGKEAAQNIMDAAEAETNNRSGKKRDIKRLVAKRQ